MSQDLITIVARDPEECLDWCGNENAGHGNHNGIFPLTPNEVTIQLHWKADAAGREVYIGTYRMNLKNLLDHGYIRHDPKPNTVRVKFIHIDGTIRLAKGKRSPGLVVGAWNG